MTESTWQKKYQWRRDKDAVSKLYYAYDGPKMIGLILEHDKGWWQYVIYSLKGETVQNWQRDTAAEAAKTVEDGWDAVKEGRALPSTSGR